MSEEISTQQGGGEALPAESSTPPAKPEPKSDAEAAALEQQEGAQPDEDKAKAEKEQQEKSEQEKAERRKNRTREYINKINRENADLRRQIAERQSSQPSAPSQPRQPAVADGEPTLEEHNFDPVAFQRAHTAWAVEQALKAERERTQQAETTQKQQQIADAYNERIADFTDEHPDFPEVVGSIAYPLSSEVQTAIMAHDKGAEIAYHLGNNDDDAFSLASIQPHLAAAAVERLASRLTAAPPQAPTPTPNPRPVSQAPAPAPTVSGRSPTETPPEKLTDDEWFKRRRNRA